MQKNNNSKKKKPTTTTTTSTSTTARKTKTVTKTATYLWPHVIQGVRASLRPVQRESMDHSRKDKNATMNVKAGC